MVVNDDLLGGLKSGLERGEPLQKVMMSLYNSGYKKDEIEEAAHALSSSPVIEKAPEESNPSSEKAKKVHAPSMKKEQKTVQKASDYEKKAPNPKNKIMIILMIALSLVFVGVLLLFLLTK